LTSFPTEAYFKYPWRKYQQRVLDELQEHLNDDHLHVIAPPGSGKTILGLEVVLRLNQPTLILAPTLSIRNQWIQRFCELFLMTSTPPDWISREIRKPRFLTVVTYQGLHAACNNLKDNEESDDEEETNENRLEESTNPNLINIIKGLREQNVKTIVVDEAHHLKNEWWQTLTKIKEQIDPVIVGLTATPPYDVTANEWQRYVELNGPVDTEISVPELVVEGNLCPHQDYVHFTLPTERENQILQEFRSNIDRIFNDISTDEIIVQAIQQHPIWINPEENLNWIYNNLSYFSACLIFLNHNHIEIPEINLEVIGDKKFKVPKLDYEWMEILLDFYLNKEKDHFTGFEEHKIKLENRLRRYGAIDRKQINFSHYSRISSSLISSISKLKGIKEIVDFEYEQMRQDLRMVILSDFIRKDFFVSTSENNMELNKMGVMPIFEMLRRDNKDNQRIAVLTGSLTIIPKSAIESFKKRAAQYGISNINSSHVAFDRNYIQIHQNSNLKNDLVHIVTQIFQEGKIEVLIGTKSLLGEGWDAPAINSLILASFVGSFVLSNQMRGRAIRTQAGNQNKTGNIWHLVCVDPTSHSGGDDLELLKRRFRGFVGVSFDEDPNIENGINRLNFPENITTKEEVDKINRDIFRMAADRESLKERWHKALERGVRLVEEIKIPFPKNKEYKKVKSLYLNKTIANLIAALSFLVTFYLETILEIFGRTARNIRTVQDLYVYLTIFGIGGILFFGRLTYRTLRLYILYRDISKDINQIGETLLSSLCQEGIISSEKSKLRIVAYTDSIGAIYCHLEGGTTFEKSIFINALQEIISPVDNPRYVIIRKSRLLPFIWQKDYHSVPEILGRNKSSSTFFKNKWEEFVGRCELIYTRTIEGRRMLLKSRMKSLASQFEENLEHVNKWK
tara:strand:+ start:1032 stop:3752 length:2721 start_codon:yes stop_codon:yes gene_type:complete